MAKICKNCGLEIADSHRVCGYCGTVYTEDKASFYAPAAGTKAKSRRIAVSPVLFTIVSIISVALCFVVVYSLFFSPTAVARRAMNLFLDGEYEDLADMKYDLYDSDTSTDDIAESYENSYDSMGDTFESLLDDEDFTLVFEITNISVASKKELEKENEYLEEQDAEEIDGYAWIEILVKAIPDDGDDAEEKLYSASVIKVDGRWRLLELNVW